jgi:polyisoprenoid-binding protein YceI
MKQIWVVIALLALGLFAQAQTFSLSEGSEARFYIDEVLLGNDKTVVGTTPGVTGEIQFDVASPQATTVGVITVDASQLATDDNRRNGQIQNRILESSSEEFKFITFEPTSITGLPEAVAAGDTFNVQMIGNLTIHGVTVVSETELQGLGSTTILHADYGLSIPRVPMVASVEDDVKLEIAFTAVAQ